MRVFLFRHHHQNPKVALNLERNILDSLRDQPLPKLMLSARFNSNHAKAELFSYSWGKHLGPGFGVHGMRGVGGVAYHISVASTTEAQASPILSTVQCAGEFTSSSTPRTRTLNRS